MNKDDQVYVDILEVDVEIKDTSGIISVGHLPGMVPPFEEQLARRKVGYTFKEWEELDWAERAIEVAMLRLENRIEAIQAEEAKNK